MKMLRFIYDDGSVRTKELSAASLENILHEMRYRGLNKVETFDPVMEMVPEWVNLKGEGVPDHWSPATISRTQFVALIQSFGINAKIPAIKFARTVLPGAIGLKEAKELVDAIFDMPKPEF